MSTTSIEYAASRLSSDQLLAQLKQLGFAFAGQPGRDGRQQATLPEGWAVIDHEQRNHHIILDDKRRHRLTLTYGSLVADAFHEYYGVKVELPLLGSVVS